MKPATHPHTQPLVVVGGLAVAALVGSVGLWQATSIRPGNTAAGWLVRPIVRISLDKDLVVFNFNQPPPPNPQPQIPASRNTFSELGATLAAPTAPTDH